MAIEIATSHPDAHAIADDPAPLGVQRSAWWRWATPALSLAILAAVAWQFRSLDFVRIRDLIPTTPLFWAVFALSYVTPIAVDFAIFRLLWRIPAEGFVALARKQVSNELLVDYVGEVYFYGWARKKLAMTTSPFGAVKDVAILSALAGNGFTLAMMAAAYPYLGRAEVGRIGETILASVGLIIIVSILVLVFGRRLFSLTRSQLWAVFALQLGRIVATTGLIALAWSLALPRVSLGWWILLATVRLMLARLPLLTNKDVLFAGVAVFLIGRDQQIDALMALMATIVLATHLIVGAALAVGDLVTVDRSRKGKD